MVRPHPVAPSTLRNRNRITNKSRLRVHFGNIDADPIIPDEDEEKNRMLQRVAGVDQEDANEHHLQQVLSEAAARHQSTARTRSADKAEPATAAYIPTPDSNGVADNYEQLYPAKKWRDPVTYVQSSQTVEESCHGALAHGCTYFMDERDKEWLNKNNEEARGEGTSAQAAAIAGTRTSARSTKGKGKESNAFPSIEMSEDHFELVMGLFELITHKETEYLHHSLQEGMAFPLFSNYQDTFANPLSPSHFANFTIPNGVPPAPQLLRMASNIYPYWKERRIERNGHRIIPQLNGNESDTLHESYVCFRRREVKAARKTRGSQPNSSERLMTLQKQLHEPFELAKRIFKREALKRESSHHALNIWQRRVAIVDLRRRNPSFADKADDELLIDKELMLRKSDFRRQAVPKLDLGLSSAAGRSEPVIQPSERCAILNTRVEGNLQKRKEKDHQWEDTVDNPYISPLAPYSSRLFKYIPATTNTPSAPEEDRPWMPQRQPRPVRLRRGRGGRMHVDRHEVLRTIHRVRTSNDAMDVDEDPEADNRLRARWRFDSDDNPAIGSAGTEEQDRVLVEDYDTKYLHHVVKFSSDLDPHIVTDPSLIKFTSDGRREIVVPFKLGNTAATTIRREVSRPNSQGPMISQSAQQAQAQAAAAAQQSMPSGTPISMQQQIKMSAVPERPMRISSNGGMRTPASAMTNGLQSPPHSASPTHSNMQFSSPINSPTNPGRAAINMPHLDSVVKMDTNFASPPPPNSAVPSQTPLGSPPISEGIINGNYITRPKSQDPNAVLSSNPYQMNGYQTNPQFVGQNTALLKQILAAQGQDIHTMHANGMRQVPSSYMHANFNGLKMPNRQQSQWPPSSPMQRPASAANGFDGVNASPHMGHAAPARTPSANGLMRTMMSPHMQQSSPSPVALNPQSPRPPPTPVMSPSQPIGGY